MQLANEETGIQTLWLLSLALLTTVLWENSESKITNAEGEMSYYLDEYPSALVLKKQLPFGGISGSHWSHIADMIHSICADKRAAILFLEKYNKSYCTERLKLTTHFQSWHTTHSTSPLTSWGSI